MVWLTGGSLVALPARDDRRAVARCVVVQGGTTFWPKPITRAGARVTGTFGVMGQVDARRRLFPARRRDQLVGRRLLKCVPATTRLTRTNTSLLGLRTGSWSSDRVLTPTGRLRDRASAAALGHDGESRGRAASTALPTALLRRRRARRVKPRARPSGRLYQEHHGPSRAPRRAPDRLERGPRHRSTSTLALERRACAPARSVELESRPRSYAHQEVARPRAARVLSASRLRARAEYERPQPARSGSWTRRTTATSLGEISDGPRGGNRRSPSGGHRARRPANQLGFDGGQVGVYVSRWWEFLCGRPARGQQPGRRLPGDLRHGHHDADHDDPGRTLRRARRTLPAGVRQAGPASSAWCASR